MENVDVTNVYLRGTFSSLNDVPAKLSFNSSDQNDQKCTIGLSDQAWEDRAVAQTPFLKALAKCFKLPSLDTTTTVYYMTKTGKLEYDDFSFTKKQLLKSSNVFVELPQLSHNEWMPIAGILDLIVRFAVVEKCGRAHVFDLKAYQSSWGDVFIGALKGTMPSGPPIHPGVEVIPSPFSYPFSYPFSSFAIS